MHYLLPALNALWVALRILFVGYVELHDQTESSVICATYGFDGYKNLKVNTKRQANGLYMIRIERG